MKSLVNKKEINGGALAFLLMAITAIVMFLPFVIVDKGLFQYCGDFNSQQIPFYYYVNNFMKNAGGQWSWETDLGASVVNGYSFYLLGSPFFWFTALFPASFVPYMMVPMFGIKFGVGALGAYLFIRRYTKTKNAAVLGACLYMCSGFTIYNTFFNHFVDCIALFPFLLWALDGFVYNKKFGVFTFFVAVNLVNNYFFFFGEIVFLFIYFIVKTIKGDYKIKLKQFLHLAGESVLGVGLGCVLLIPAIMSLLENPRTIDLSNGFGLLLYDKAQQYFAIFFSLFLPPDSPYMPVTFTQGVVKWTSLSAFLPIVGCAGVLAYMRARKKSAFSTILLVCLFMAMVPILNSSFYAFNSSYYARWFYMPILLMCAATAHCTEDEQINIIGSIKIVGLITAAYAIFGLVPRLKDEKYVLGVTDDVAKFWLSVFTALLMLLIFYFIVKWYRTKPRFVPVLLGAVLIFTVFYGAIHISIGKFEQWENDANYRTDCYVGARNAVLPEGFYRIDAYECYDNVGLWFNKPSLHFFNSTVTPAIMKFYPPLSVKRDVSSKPDADLYGLHSSLSVRYMVVPHRKNAEFVEKYLQYGWRMGFSDEYYNYYENTNYIPMGFVYDSYYRNDELESVAEKSRNLMLVRAIGLSAQQEIEYKHLFTQKAATTMLSYESFVDDAANRRASAAYEFEASGKGFTAKIKMDKENLVFFSIPYDGGFSATINGEKVEVIEVSNGMSAVKAPAGDNEIVFTYFTPGLKISIAITLVSALIFAFYLYWIFSKKRLNIQILKKENEGEKND